MDIVAHDMMMHHSSTFSDPPPQIHHFSPPLPPPSFISPRICSSDNVNSMREMIFRMAVMQPVHIDPESVKPRKRRNVRISKDPQSVAARHRRERISEKIRILQRLVPGGTKMDTASMLDEAIHYVKFLKKQVEQLGDNALGNGMDHLLKGSCQHAHRCNAAAST